MNFASPPTGFCVVTDKERNLSEIKHTFELNRAATCYLSEDNILIASWTQFDDQGQWSDGVNAVAYDMDLTNQADLVALVNELYVLISDKGHLIWLLYQKYGIAFLDRLRGSFAFTLWDGGKKKLYVTTDPYGLKTVVYSENRGTFYTASRIRHILWAAPELKEINNDAIFHYLFFQAICTPITIYQGIHKLEPGKCLEFHKQTLKKFTYYDIKYHPDRTLTETKCCHLIREELEKSVKTLIPLSPPDKTGCFLSGGTDSSSVAGYYTKLSGKPARTFSIGFDDPKYNELDYARIAANHFGTDYNEYYVTPHDVVTLIDKLSTIYDEPFGNASVIPAYYCAVLAQEHGVDVLLGGDGGDEIFGGNERYVTNLIFQRYLELPGFIRAAIFEPLLSKMPDIGAFHKAKRYVRRANMRNPERFYSYNLLAETDLTLIFQQDFLNTLNTDSFMDIAKQHYKNAAPAHDTDRLLYIDMKFTITDNDIRKVTRMVEAAGIRVRYPYLDRDLVDFTTTIPPEMKVKWGKNRYIFKKAMKGFLPDEIISKSKHGMGLPVTPWFKHDKQMNALLYDTLFTRTTSLSQYIKPEFIQKMKSSFEQDDSTYYGDNLWVFLILEMWLKQ